MSTDVLPRAPFEAPQLGTPQRSPAQLDRSLAKVLSVFYAVLGVIYLVASLIPIGVLVNGERVLLTDSSADGAFDLVFGVVGVLMVLLMAGVGVANVLASKWLNRRTHRTALMAIAAVNCFLMPHGLVLGVATFVLLSRETLRYEFDRVSPEQAP